LLLRTQWLSAAVFGPAAVVLLLASNGLAALFHVPSPDLFAFMAILVLGQSINAATGLSGVLLNLTGAARTEWRISLAALGLAVLLAAPAGSSHGATGLAVSFAVIITLKNIASWLAARRHITYGELVQ
jgi:O-antigen/teichoic acid export membrane protein